MSTIEAGRTAIAENRDSAISRRTFLVGALAAVATGCRRTMVPVAADGEQEGRRSLEEAREREQAILIRSAVLGYLSGSRFGGADFTQRFTGRPVRPERYYRDVGMLFLSVDAGDFRDAGELLAPIALDAERVDFAHAEEEGVHRFLNERKGQEITIDIVPGKSRLHYRETGRYLFGMKSNQLRIDPDRPITWRRGPAIYDATPRELKGFMANETIYRGFQFIIDDDGHTFNFGSMVARPGEPSLTRLVRRLVRPEDPPETKTQKISDFVTNHIAYSHADVAFERANNMELVKRPNEVIMTGEGDCASKTILLASLYEQAGLDYRMIYVLAGPVRAGHLALLVTGAFPKENGLEFRIGEGTFAVSDATCRDFQIGRTEVGYPFHEMHYVQHPSDGRVIDAKTGRVVREAGARK
ncbi:MAG: hypothetical protein Greene041619_879 [Candidatus Peregrinibacteria bacterium Greene0416_19]|nr:MAG: hypothetical protein Greene041619_879 [Candidatus Peregrinibacteria bacterium Greene0416_19]